MSVASRANKRLRPLLVLAVVVGGCRCRDLAVDVPSHDEDASTTIASAATRATPEAIRAFCAEVFDPLGLGARSRCTDADHALAGFVELAAQVEFDVQRCTSALDDERRTFVDANAIPRCLARLRTIGQSDDPSLDARDDCAPVVHGHQPQGAPCRDQLQCVDGLVCVGDQQHEEGTCEPPRPSGGSCLPTFDVLQLAAVDRQCPAGEFCDPDARVCTKQKKRGEPCTYDEGCVLGLACSLRVCAERRAQVGEACRDDIDCVRADWCDGKTGTCAAKKAAKSACADDRECRGRCVNKQCRSFCGSG